MAYVGIGNQARKITNLYIGVNNMARKVKKAYIGVDGVARLWWDASTPGGGDEPDIPVVPGNYPMLKPGMTWFAKYVNSGQEDITSISFVDTYTPTGLEDFHRVADVNGTGAITVYKIGTDLIVAGNGSGGIYANPNSSSMFNSFSNVMSIDLSILNTSKVTDINRMFFGCTHLTSLDLSILNTSNVTDMSGMFYNCSNLTSLNLSNFDTSNVTWMELMFNGCENLTTLDLRSFDTSNVTRMGLMFFGCKSLSSLDISNFDTSNVIYMTQMFSNCASLTSLDLRSFDTSNVTEMENMFSSCPKLTTILATSGKWDIDQADASNMFLFCGTDHVTYA